MSSTIFPTVKLINVEYVTVKNRELLRIYGTVRLDHTQTSNSTFRRWYEPRNNGVHPGILYVPATFRRKGPKGTGRAQRNNV